MARFILNFIVLCAILLNSYVVATDHDNDSAESSEETTSSPLKCEQNEVVDDCPVDCPSDYCPKSRQDNQTKCTKPDKCPPPACKCGFNSRRAVNGTCISTRNCPPFKCNGVHEEYNPCPPYCPGETCSQATPDGECHLPGRIGIVLECKPACRCKKNYWRLNGTCVPYARCPKSKNTTIRTKKPILRKATVNENGNCVPYNKCPNVNNSVVTTEKNTPNTTTEDNDANETSTTAMSPTCDDNEVLDTCPIECPSDYCPTSRFDDQSKCTKPDKCQSPACKCGFNSRRAKNGTCISTRDCRPFECNEPNEEYNACPSYCPGENCSQATPDGECHAIGKILIVVECKPECRCKKNFWRLNGTCVPYDQCQAGKRPSELPDAKTNNTSVMTTEKSPETTQVTTESTEKEVTTVSPTLTCDDNEISVECPDDCPSEYCPKSRNDRNIPCSSPDNCRPPACKCRFNHRRADNGSCINTRDCPPFACDGPYEEYNACPPYCPGEDCSQATPDGKCHIFGTIGIILECQPACRCQKNYWRLNGTCVPYEKCQPSCPKNENLVQCKNACSEKTCPKSEADTEPRLCTLECRGSGCACGFNHRRADNGTCISARDCPPFDCSARPNEMYDPCPPYCPSDSCRDATPTGKCRYRIGVILECNPKCRCIKGYWRNDSGICVPYEKCPGMCPPNEEYTNCAQTLCRPQNCSDIANGGRGFDCEPDKSDGCESGCVCKEGYLRSNNGTCVPEGVCGNQNPIECSGPYEKYTDCKKTCPGDTCSALTSKIKCEDECCKPGCVCNSGYLRKTSDGPCVPLCACPEMANAPACQNKMIKCNQG